MSGIVSYKCGLNAERHSSFFLMNKGYEIIAQRYRSSYAEIDLILLDYHCRTIVFVEIKARKNFDEFDNVVSQKQKLRIYNAAEEFMIKNEKFINYSMRFDYVFINSKNKTEIYHIENISF